MALAVGRSGRGIDFGSIDGKPTHLVLMLCAPSDALHLRMIAKLGRLMADGGLRQALQAAPDTKAFIELIRDRESH